MTDVKAACDEAVKAITVLPSEAWANWIVYIMEALDNTKDYQGVLGKDDVFDRVDCSIETRLREGHW